MTAGPLVVVDDREPDTAVSRLCAYGLQAISGRLEAGDFMWWPHGLAAVIERKTISNLLGSMSDKQLVLQAHKMVANADISFLLREGAFRCSPGGAVEYYSPKDGRADLEGWVVSGWSWESFHSIMMDIQLMGIRIADCPVLGEYPAAVARLVINLSKDEHRWIKQRERPDVCVIDPQYRNALWALCALEMIGPTTAEALLNNLGSIYEIANASVEQLRKVKGVGPKLAKSIHDEMREKWQVS